MILLVIETYTIFFFKLEFWLSFEKSLLRERMIMYGNDVEFYDVTQDTWQRNICHLAHTFVAGEKIVHVLVSDGSFDPGVRWRF